jgi:hypothetical protein
MIDKICPGCGVWVACGRVAGADHCWCADLPRIMPVPDASAGCYCPDCLALEILRRQENEAKP